MKIEGEWEIYDQSDGYIDVHRGDQFKWDSDVTWHPFTSGGPFMAANGLRVRKKRVEQPTEFIHFL